MKKQIRLNGFTMNTVAPHSPGLWRHEADQGVRHGDLDYWLDLAKLLEAGKGTRFGADWPGQRCGAKTRRGTPCLKAAIKGRNRCRNHGGCSTGVSGERNGKYKHGRSTKQAIANMRASSRMNATWTNHKMCLYPVSMNTMSAGASHMTCIHELKYSLEKT